MHILSTAVLCLGISKGVMHESIWQNPCAMAGSNEHAMEGSWPTESERKQDAIATVIAHIIIKSATKMMEDDRRTYTAVLQETHDRPPKQRRC